MKCPKCGNECNEDAVDAEEGDNGCSFYETRLDVIGYNWLSDGGLDDLEQEGSLLTLSAICSSCGYEVCQESLV